MGVSSSCCSWKVKLTETCSLPNGWRGIQHLVGTGSIRQPTARSSARHRPWSGSSSGDRDGRHRAPKCFHIGSASWHPCCVYARPQGRLCSWNWVLWYGVFGLLHHSLEQTSDSCTGGGGHVGCSIDHADDLEWLYFGCRVFPYSVESCGGSGLLFYLYCPDYTSSSIDYSNAKAASWSKCFTLQIEWSQVIHSNCNMYYDGAFSGNRSTNERILTQLRLRLSISDLVSYCKPCL